MTPRPASIKVLGILNLCFAGMGLLGILGSVAMFFVKFQTNNPVIQLGRENAFYGTWLKVSMGIGLIAFTMELVSGIGLLRLREWGRKLAIAYAIAAIPLCLASAAINSTVLLPAMLEQAKQHEGPEAAGAIAAGIGAAAGGCFGVIYPIVLLIFMLRRNVVAAFRAGPPVPPPIPLA